MNRPLPTRIAGVAAGALLALASVVSAEGESSDDAAAGAKVSVRFTAPEKFTDAVYENRISTREEVMKDLSAYLVSLGARYLPPGRRLEIEVTDVDLAGRYEPWHIQTRDVRYLRDSTWPRVNLKYRLLESDIEIAQGEETVSDLHYLTRVGLRSDSDRLRYEKTMLDYWFRSRFAAKPPQDAARKP